MDMGLRNSVNEHGAYKMYRADSGAISFQVKLSRRVGCARLALTGKNSPEKILYEIELGPVYKILDYSKVVQIRNTLQGPEPIGEEFMEFLLTWYNNDMCLSLPGQKYPFLKYTDDNICNNGIGYVKFYTSFRNYPVEWIYDAPPIMYSEISYKMIDDGIGSLSWQSCVNSYLPPDALIGGFENEPLYIARATHNGSLCPGKYVPSKGVAFVPWGGRSHVKQNFEILCGFDVKWVKTRGDLIPENAFVAGFSEVRHGPLYIGRAMLNDNLINGKVHTLYKTCYLPYNEKEVEVNSYEILVSPVV